MKINSFFGSENVTVSRSTYSNNDTLAIIMTCEDGEPYGILTVNLPNERAYLSADTYPKDMYQFVDTNNNPFAEDFIRENELGEFTGIYGQSGFCSYPLYRFNIKNIREEI